MVTNRGRWIGFTMSGCFIGLIALSVYSVVAGHEPLAEVFRMVCHQHPDRCYHLDGLPLPLCVRCIWIYFGFAAGHVVFIFWRPHLKRITQALIGVIILMLLDVSLEMLGVYSNLFWTRGLTGFLFGLTVSHFTLLGLRELYLELTNSKNYVRSKLFTFRSR